MQQDAGLVSKVALPSEVPGLVRFFGKLVVEVLPAALASVIGAFLFAHYQFGQPAAPAAVATGRQALPASAEMLRLVREEHAMVRDFLVAQQAAEEKRAAAADAADARAVADAKIADVVIRRVAGVQAIDKAAVGRSKPKVVVAANGATPSATTRLPTILVATAAPPATFPPQPAAASPTSPMAASLVSRTLGVPEHVLAETLHAVMAIGGIPSWIGHRVNAMAPDIPLPTASAAS